MKKNLIILGTGFGAYSLIKSLPSDLYQVTVISPRNYFLFTPLLPSTTVGTIEFRSIIEPIRHSAKYLTYLQAFAERIDTTNKTIGCRSAILDEEFEVKYDVLVIAVGASNNTFGIEGVKEHAVFLKELDDARILRRKILDNFELAALPTIPVEERHRLLHTVVVGGGPTGVEFAAELSDFLEDELTYTYPQLISSSSLTIVEAGKQLLNLFDEKLSLYAGQLFSRRKIRVMTNTVVKKVSRNKLFLNNNSELDFGLLVWSTGNTSNPFIQKLPFEKDRNGRILTDSNLLIKGLEDIYAIGDCATPSDFSQPATAQVAMQEGKYLATVFKKKATHSSFKPKPFLWQNFGMLAYIGDNKALADLPQTKSSGFGTWIFWRSAYLTKLVSLKNKVQVLYDWLKASIFGRDVSRF
ncbi:MAG: FAD-dependent oxidoreductase [Chloroherpetonaceae bacterium]|nr:FAD-dependent oxidoreductase [Chloroherpetonaceae bacterium]